MHHVEGSDSVACVAPDHRSFLSIGDREFPDGGIEVRHSHSHHPILPIALGERLAEDCVQRRNLTDADALRRLRDPRMSPVTRESHYARAPAGYSADSSET